MTSTTLLDLAQRVEAGSGVDRKLDAEIYWHCVCSRLERYRERDGIREVNVIHPSHGEDWRPYSEVNEPLVTSSLDAVERLRERLLPRSDYEVTSEPDTIYALINTGKKAFTGKAPTAPRARLAAILRAYAGRAG